MKRSIVLFAIMIIGMMAYAQHGYPENVYDSPIVNEQSGTSIVETDNGYTVTTTVTANKALDLLVQSIKGKTNTVISNDTQVLFSIFYTVKGYQVLEQNDEEVFTSTRIADVRNYVKDILRDWK